VNFPDILFQFSSSDASTDLTDGHLVYTAPEGGQTMISQFIFCPSFGGNSNFFRIYHGGPDETPSTANMIFRAGSNSASKAPDNGCVQVKVILQPGDRIYCQLHSGDGITITAYGIIPARSSSQIGVPTFEKHSPLKGDGYDEQNAQVERLI